MSGQDPYIALLQYRLTPLAGIPYSPAQMLMGRQLRGKLPISPKLLRPAKINARPFLVECQRAQKRHYDKTAKPLPPLQSGDSIRMQRKGKWEPAVVIKSDKAPRSYIVNCNGTTYRRNRRHLLSTPHVPPPRAQDAFLDDYMTPCPDDLDAPHEEIVPPTANVMIPGSPPRLNPEPENPQVVTPEPPVSTRPRRERQPPVRYRDDYV